QARDTVNMSNGVTWPVRYHYEHGQNAQALAIAEKAADTWSAGGMQTLAFLYDAMGRYGEAERLYKRSADRYDRTVELGAFYVRQSRRPGDREQEARGVSMLKEAFPNGLETVTLQALSAPPLDGVVVVNIGPRAEQIGVRKGDVIVAVD